MNVTPFTIVTAEPSMLQTILEIENASFTCPWSERSFREAFEARNITVYAALSQDTKRPVGFSCLLTIDGEGELLNIAADPSTRRCGVGQLLMDTMLADCAAHGVHDLYLEVRSSNTAARALYEKNGFTAIGVRRRYYTKPVEDAVVMRLTLEVEN